MDPTAITILKSEITLEDQQAAVIANSTEVVDYVMDEQRAMAWLDNAAERRFNLFDSVRLDFLVSGQESFIIILLSNSLKSGGKLFVPKKWAEIVKRLDVPLTIDSSHSSKYVMFKKE